MADDRMTAFLDLASALTGFSPFEVKSTGQAQPYLATVEKAVGPAVVDELLAAFRGVQDERGLRRAILSDEKLGPIARNLIKLWYVGTWHEMPQEWRDVHGTNPDDRTHVVSPTAYTEGLLWPAIGANPSGAKPFGYGIWATPPRIATEVGEG